MTWKDNYPEGCPPHPQVNRGFKPYCMKAAADAGYTTILWLDASIVAIAPLDDLFAHIERVGYLFVHVGYMIGQYSSDRCLGVFGLTRDEAMQMPDVAGGFVGVDLTNDLARKFLDEWHRYTIVDGGGAFAGSKRNYRQQVSADPRCEGHRQDQTVASIIVNQLGIKDLLHGGNWQVVTNCLRVEPHPRSDE